MKKHKKDIIQLGVLLLVLIGYVYGNTIWYKLFPTADQYGVKFNKERIRRGILPLPGNWTTANDEKETKVWFPPKSDINSIHRGMKVVGVAYDRIKYENDFILKPLPNKEELALNYRYDTTPSWTYTFSSSLTNQRPNVITREQVDSILKAWDFHIDSSGKATSRN
ncbi:hypothetical protein SAMN05518672_101676 [Chitinophaga sp. CF118]|uniref:hypothetical protein n=1 Tax=Chitinophaga sp. CF118 TaxID=1884367 RepID=UPI0008F2574F|nr:hypothetical protein [Chitinophaga sp. CF118]SFD14020.1 hypothetical protein SAMN05518672_101676 [Chitinophaga sp. CF118]